MLLCTNICKTERSQILKKRPNYFLLLLSLSVSFSNTSVAFNLAFILPHSQYHPQSVSTLQHSPCVSHLSLSQLLTLSSPSSDTQTERQKGKFWALRFNPVSRRLKMLSQTFPIPFPPHGQQQNICPAYAEAFLHSGTDFLFTFAVLCMRIHNISAHEMGYCCRRGRSE